MRIISDKIAIEGRFAAGVITVIDGKIAAVEEAAADKLADFLGEAAFDSTSSELLGDSAFCGTSAELFEDTAFDGTSAELLGDTAFDGTSAKTLDARGLTVYPGFIDAHSHIGMIGSGMGIEGDDINEDSEPVTPHLRAIDALDPFDSAFDDARRAGITTVVTGSGSANAIGGDLIAVKTAGHIADEMLIKTVGIKFALGENPKSSGEKDSMPVTRMGTAALIREALFKARRYMSEIEAAGQTEDETTSEPSVDPSVMSSFNSSDEPSVKLSTEHSREQDDDLPEFDMKSEALIPLLARRIKAYFHCHKACDIVTAVRIAEEFDLDYVLVHCSEGYLIADFLGEIKASAIVGPIIGGKTKPELAGASEKNAGVLAASGAAVAICTDHPEIPEHYLRLSADIAAQNGLRDPIAAITSTAARIISLSDKIGVIKPGFDADFAITDDTGNVKFTIINGKAVFSS